MNKERLNQLIEATKTYEGFDMRWHETCLCAVARSIHLGYNPSEGFWSSEDLANWLEWPEGKLQSQEQGGWNTAKSNLVIRPTTREKAIAALEHLRDTGDVLVVF